MVRYDYNNDNDDISYILIYHILLYIYLVGGRRGEK